MLVVVCCICYNMLAYCNFFGLIAVSVCITPKRALVNFTVCDMMRIHTQTNIARVISIYTPPWMSWMVHLSRNMSFECLFQLLFICYIPGYIPEKIEFHHTPAVTLSQYQFSSDWIRVLTMRCEKNNECTQPEVIITSYLHCFPVRLFSTPPWLRDGDFLRRFSVEFGCRSINES